MTELAKYVIRDFRNLLIQALRDTNEYREVRVKPNDSNVIQLISFDETEIEVRVTARITKE